MSSGISIHSFTFTAPHSTSHLLEPQTIMDNTDQTNTQESGNEVAKGTRAARGTLTRWSASKDQAIALAAAEAFTHHSDMKIWETIGKNLDPPATGSAILQHFAKVRAAREAAGLFVPPHKNPSHIPRPLSERSPYPSLLPVEADNKKRPAKRVALAVLPTGQTGEVDDNSVIVTSENDVGAVELDLEYGLDIVDRSLAEVTAEASLMPYSSYNY